MKSYKGVKYIMLFVDDYSRMMTIMFMKQKFDAFQMFKWYLARVEKEIGKSIKCLRSDRGGEFTSKDRHLHLEPLHKIELLKGGTNL